MGSDRRGGIATLADSIAAGADSRLPLQIMCYRSPLPAETLAIHFVLPEHLGENGCPDVSADTKPMFVVRRLAFSPPLIFLGTARAKFLRPRSRMRNV
jgi:hypothetical protein